MDLINLDKYPLDAPRESRDYKKCISDLRSKLVHEGVATCPNFLRGSAVAQAVSDITKVQDKAWKTDTRHNIYLDMGDSALPSNHIRNRLLPTSVRLLSCYSLSVLQDFKKNSTGF